MKPTGMLAFVALAVSAAGFGQTEATGGDIAVAAPLEVKAGTLHPEVIRFTPPPPPKEIPAMAIEAMEFGEGLLLIEACRETGQGGGRLKLEVVRKSDNTIAAEVALPVAICAVESMFRHKNLRMDAPQVEPDKEADHPPAADRPDNPDGLPDSYCNDDWLVFLKGLLGNTPQETGGILQQLASLATQLFSGLSPATEPGGWRVTPSSTAPFYASLISVPGGDPAELYYQLNSPTWFADQFNAGSAFIERLRVDPVFGTRVAPDCDGLFSEINGTGHTISADPIKRRRILAQMIPERTLPAGGAGGSGVVDLIDSLATKFNAATGDTIQVYDMQANRNGWPAGRPPIDPTQPTRAGNGWRHGDVRKVAYLHVWRTWREVATQSGIDRMPAGL